MKALSSKSKRNYRIVLLAIALLLVSVVSFRIYQHARKNGKSPVTSSQYAVLNARVVWTDDFIRVINLDDHSWSDCQFILNQNQTRGGYTLYRERVLSKEVLQIAHHLFIDSNGIAFDIKKQNPDSFLIRCENVVGKVGLFSGKYSSN